MYSQNFFKSNLIKNKKLCEKPIETCNIVETKAEIKKKDTEISIDAKLENLLNKVAGFDSILLDIKNQQEEFKKIPLNSVAGCPLIPTTNPCGTNALPSEKVQSLNLHDNKMNVSGLTSCKAPKKRKKVYQKVTDDIVESFVGKKFAEFPKEFLKHVYTIDGNDIYVEHKNKKIPIENGGHVLKLVNLAKKK